MYHFKKIFENTNSYEYIDDMDTAYRKSYFNLVSKEILKYEAGNKSLLITSDSACQEMKNILDYISKKYNISQSSKQNVSLPKSIVDHSNAPLPNDLSAVEKSKLIEYSNFAYKSLNPSLRANTLYGDNKMFDKILSNIFKRSNTINDITVYRFVDMSEDDFKNAYCIKSNIKIKTYVSTTTSWSFACKMANGGFHEESKYGILEIKIPKGSRAISIKEIAVNEDEEEIIIDKNYMYKYLGEYKKNNFIVTKLQLIR